MQRRATHTEPTSAARARAQSGTPVWRQRSRWGWCTPAPRCCSAACCKGLHCLSQPAACCTPAHTSCFPPSPQPCPPVPPRQAHEALRQARESLYRLQALGELLSKELQRRRSSAGSGGGGTTARTSARRASSEGGATGRRAGTAAAAGGAAGGRSSGAVQDVEERLLVPPAAKGTKRKRGAPPEACPFCGHCYTGACVQALPPAACREWAAGWCCSMPSLACRWRLPQPLQVGVAGGLGTPLIPLSFS